MSKTKNNTPAKSPVIAFAVEPEIKDKIVHLAKQNDRTICAQIRRMLKFALGKCKD